ncbi:MAG: class I SAM-dependent methyltransferase [Verrucomicrobiota bacterium]|jgi:ubiquinone/menaquinone biosynthesis C-methylase UbiE
MKNKHKKITIQAVKDHFNDPVAVVHYTRAAHNLGLWKSEEILIDRFFKDKSARLLEAGCGAGRAALGLWNKGYTNITAFDLADEPIEQAKSLVKEKEAHGIDLHVADATCLPKIACFKKKFDGVLFLFNGLMQIPGRDNRRKALLELKRVSNPGAPLLFTTHDRDYSPTERALWSLETLRWEKGTQDKRLVEFGDRYFSHEHGKTFMHLPNRSEILDDLSATGWTHQYDALRKEISKESAAVKDFSDECRFWLATKQ